MPQVFMAPHVGGLFEEYAQMAIPLIIGNMRAFLSGQTDRMVNRISRSRSTAETRS
jgi:phosphoglycerate dehydrogenase-like enzyme